MKLNIQSIHFDADQKLLAYIQKKCDKLDVFFDRILDADVYLKIDKDDVKGNKVVEVKLHIPGGSLVGHYKSQTFEKATDFCTEKLKTQIKRHKAKLQQRAAVPTPAPTPETED
jgi:putative sigma-54 modulation protein